MTRKVRRMANEEIRFESKAKSVEEAIEKGLAELGLSRDEVEIEIITEGSKGVFGFGGEDARVLLVKKPVEVPELPEVPAPPDEAEHAPDETEREGYGLDDDRKAEIQDASRVASEILREMLRYMGINADVSSRYSDELAEEGDRPHIILNIEGNDLGILIGRRGETLNSLQYMVRLILSNRLQRWENVMVDVESYRVRRRDSLRQLAFRMAEKASFNEQRVILEAMPPNERRIVHLALLDHPSVKTESVGAGEHRKVTIIPKNK